MSQEILTNPSHAPVLWEPPKTTAARQELQSVLLNSTFPGARAEMVGEVISYCAARQIDPLLKPVHIVPMWDRNQKRMVDTIMPGIYLYRILAARTGEYAGKTYPEWGPVCRENLGGQNVAYPEWCRMKVFRRVRGAICEFGAEEFWLENYATRGKDSKAPNQMWAKRSRGQLAKCVEAQALRMAFPEAFGGTMTLEEMDGKMGAPQSSQDGQVVDVTEMHPQELQAPQRKEERPPQGQPNHTTAEPRKLELEKAEKAFIAAIERQKTLDNLKKLTSGDKYTRFMAEARDTDKAIVDRVTEVLNRKLEQLQNTTQPDPIEPGRWPEEEMPE